MRSRWLALGVYVVGWAGACAAQPAVPPSERFLVRVEVDADGNAPGGITPKQLASWSQQEKVVRAFQDVRGGTVAEVLKRNITQTNPAALERAFALNESALKTFLCEKCEAAAAPYVLAPLGSSKISKTARAPSATLPVETFSVATKDELARVIGGETEKQRRLTVLRSDAGQAFRPVPRRRFVQLELTRQQVLSLQEALPKATMTTLNGRFLVSAEDSASGPVGPAPLSKTLTQALEHALRGKEPPSAKPLLIIVEGSWPTDEEFRETKDFIGKYYAPLWRSGSDLANTVPVPTLSNATVQMSSPGVPRGTNCQSLNTCDTHALRVDYAIAPMRKLAKRVLGNEPVNVMYIPMTASQRGAKDILRLLWNLAYAAGTDLAPDSPTFFPREEETRKRQEGQFLASLEDKLTGSEFVSNWAVVTGAYQFARRYAQVFHVPVFINMSWTSVDTSFNPPVLTAWNTLLVAAAGNHCKDEKCGEFADEMSPKREFLTRASLASDVLLVVNLNGRGQLTCNSTRVRVSHSVVGFDGAIDGDCGTSFASPRVAWLLALRAAFMPATPNSGPQQAAYLKWILGQREGCTADDDFPCIRLNPDELFAGGGSTTFSAHRRMWGGK